MVRWVKWLAVLFLAVLPVPAAAQEGKGAQELWAQCQAINSPFQQGVCLAYLGAVMDLLALGDAAEGRACPPEDYPTGRVREDYIAFLEANRDVRDKIAAAAVVTMLVSVYPCPSPSD